VVGKLGEKLIILLNIDKILAIEEKIELSEMGKSLKEAVF